MGTNDLDIWAFIVEIDPIIALNEGEFLGFPNPQIRFLKLESLW